MKIFVVSDTHWNHKNIIKYENRPEDFNEVIIDNWNKMVGEKDVVVHLGDVIFGMERSQNLIDIMSRLKGKKVLARGNHDENDWDWYMERGFDFVCDYYVYKNIAFSHAPLTPLPKQTLLNNGQDVQYNIHGHFHRGNHRAPKNDDPNFHDDFYDYSFWRNNKEKYKLIQIEDELRPFTLEEVLAR